MMIKILFCLAEINLSTIFEREFDLAVLIGLSWNFEDSKILCQRLKWKRFHVKMLNYGILKILEDRVLNWDFIVDCEEHAHLWFDILEDIYIILEQRFLCCWFWGCSILKDMLSKIYIILLFYFILIKCWAVLRCDWITMGLVIQMTWFLLW